jgi:hypothetical protein
VTDRGVRSFFELVSTKSKLKWIKMAACKRLYATEFECSAWLMAERNERGDVTHWQRTAGELW